MLAVVDSTLWSRRLDYLPDSFVWLRRLLVALPAGHEQMCSQQLGHVACFIVIWILQPNRLACADMD